MLAHYVLAAVLLPTVVLGHHSFALYSDDVIEVEGEIVDVAWRNPHARLTLSTANGEWALEGAPIYVLERRGITRDLFPPGARLSVSGRANRRGRNELWLHSILLPDGREAMMIGGIEPRWTANIVGGDGILEVEDAASQNLGIFRVWSRPALRPLDYGAGLPYIQPLRSGGAEWMDRLNGLGDRCEPMGLPGVMSTPYPFEFTDNGSTIRLRGFSNNAMIDRTIHLDEDASFVPGITGYSVGRWESERRLVVETTQIDWPYFDDSTGMPQSEEVQVREVLTLNEDQTRLDYQVVVTDPTLFAEPTVVVEMYWLALGEARAEPSDCIE